MRKVKKLTGWLLAATLLVPNVASAEEIIIPFIDVHKHWAVKSIVKSYTEGLMGGARYGYFEPERYMSRAEFMVLLDRLFLQNEEQLYTLTMLSEHDEIGWGEGFDFPYLPYKDVTQMTWMYEPILRMSVAYNNVYGPDALHVIFPGEQLHPNQPITIGEVEQLLQLFSPAAASSTTFQKLLPHSWLKVTKTDGLKRGEAAVLAEKLMDYFSVRPILPLLDADGNKFPAVPEIAEVFPLFGVFTDQPSAEERIYLKATEAIRNYEEDADTFKQLHKLADDNFYNQVGVHYYLSWDPDVKLQDNMEEAFRAIDAYFADRVVKPETLQLLVANVYDLALKLEKEQGSIYAKLLDRLGPYEAKTKRNAEEWQAIAIYMAALEVKSGSVDKAIERYQQFSDDTNALLNYVYYLASEGNEEGAKNVLATVKAATRDEKIKLLVDTLQQELDLLGNQQRCRTDLSFALRQTEQSPSYEVDGEAMFSGFLFKYKQQVDNNREVSHISGYFRDPDKLVLEKMEKYADDHDNVEYIHDFNGQTWSKKKQASVRYLHEWFDSLSVKERNEQLNVRYNKQSFGNYDVITEWVTGTSLQKRAESLYLDSGAVKGVPQFVTKYYIDKGKNVLVRKAWRYEEIYDKDYVAYTGNELYSNYGKVEVRIPSDVVKGAVAK